MDSLNMVLNRLRILHYSFGQSSDTKHWPDKNYVSQQEAENAGRIKPEGQM